jgi:glutamate synthase (NADPH/NADH) small chain
MELQEVDSSGRQKVKEIPGSEFEEEADVVIFALGFSHQPLPFLKDIDMKKNEWGGIVVDENKQTSIKMVYAGGDCVRGAHLAVTAARDGRDAAFDMISKLLQN